MHRRPLLPAFDRALDALDETLVHREQLLARPAAHDFVTGSGEENVSPDRSPP
jgi:hypothetical protein